ncbi:MAG: diacylglycerol/lipid kinase family protein [Candidatus Hodarchaeota archaeon]
MTSYLFIVNPLARGGKNRNASKRISGYLESLDQGVDYSVLVSERVGHVIELARENKDAYDVIVSAGGDGTVNEVVNGIGPHDSTKIGILPLGTGNDTCRSKGSFTSLEKALDIILNGSPAITPAGKVTGEGFIPEMSTVDGENARYCVNNFLTLFAAVVGYASLTEAKWIKFGFKFTYLAIKKAFAWKNIPATVILDDQVLKFDNLVLACAGLGENVGAGMKMFPNTIPFNLRGFPVLIGSEVGNFTILRLLGSIRSGKHIEHKNVDFYTGIKHIEVETEKPMICDVDSVYPTYTPVSIDFIPDAFQFIVDPSFKESELERKKILGLAHS